MGHCASRSNRHDNEFQNIYVIGANGGELSLNNAKRRDTLTLFNKYNKAKHIDRINSANGHTIYYNHQQQNYWIASIKIPKIKCIQYFKRNDIKIQTICTSIAAKHSFFISTKNKAYYMLGIDKYRDLKIISINNLNNVIDIKSTWDATLALCDDKKTIISILNNWSIPSKNGSNAMPDDIINLIVMYSPMTGMYIICGITDNIDLQSKCISFPIKNMTQIECGAHHALFLDIYGNVWSFGSNKYGQCGKGDVDKAAAEELKFKRSIAFVAEGYKGVYDENSVSMIEYFMDNNIKIIDIKCGANHCLALDDKYNVYSWGYNSDGQCGDGTINNNYLPKLMQYLKEYKITQIDCGLDHSFAQSEEDMHFIWGNNRECQCITRYGYASEPSSLRIPQSFDKIIDQQTNGKSIKYVSLGICNTKIIVSNLIT